MPLSVLHTSPPPAPGRLITTMFCLYFAWNTCACMRAVMSDSPPGANGMMYCTGLSGEACAAPAGRSAAAATPGRQGGFIVGLILLEGGGLASPGVKHLLGMPGPH